MKLQMILVSLVFGSLFFSGCASKNMQANNSGFFKDYEKIDTQLKQKADLSKYKKIMLSKIEVKPMIQVDEQTSSQKKLYDEVRAYLSSEYKKSIQESSRFTLSDTPSEDTLILQSSVSTIEVHYDDSSWNQIAPVPMGLNVVSFNIYLDEDVRLLGESRLVDSKTDEVLLRNMNVDKDIVINISGDTLTLEDLKPALDAYVSNLFKGLN